MYIEPTTPLGFVSVQHILDTIHDMDNYERGENGTDIVVKSFADEHAAVSLLEIHSPIEPGTKEVDDLAVLIAAALADNVPTYEEYMAATNDNTSDE